jgi:hypothetical protein
LHIEFLVEELSAQEFLFQVLPQILTTNITYDIHAFRGKTDLIKKLPSRLKGYKNWISNDYKIVVLVDKDDDDCQELKNELEKIATDTGFITKSTAQVNQPYQVLNRIAIEELEAWFFGDIEAIVKAYPKVSLNLGKQAPYRDPDAIAGGTWEALERVLKKAGYHRGGLEKVKAAREISQSINPQKNCSKSFQVFYQGLLEIIA